MIFHSNRTNYRSTTKGVVYSKRNMQLPGVVTVTVGAIRVSVTVSDFTSIEVVITDDDMMVDNKVVDTGDGKMVSTGDDKVVNIDVDIVTDKDIDIAIVEIK